jgi:hypothetical protein
MKILTL